MEPVMQSAPQTTTSSSYGAGPIRDVALPLSVLALTYFLSSEWIIRLFVITGQAHFVLAYVYQYRGKKMNRLYAGVALLLLALFTLYFFLSGAVLPLLLATGFLFAAHFAYDEITLHDETPTFEKMLSVVGFTLLFLSFVISYAFSGLVWVAVAGMASVAVLVLTRLFIGSVQPSRAERYIWFVMLLLPVLAFGFGHPERILGIVVLLHVSNWYVGYGMRLRSRPDRSKRYWLEVLATLTGASILFALFLQFHITALGLFFGLGAYYAWAIAHIALSLVASLPRKA